MTKPNIITVKNLTKAYEEADLGIQAKALDEVTFTIEEGDFAVLAGPSGSGKTTLLNILGALDTPTSGEVIVDQTSLGALSPAKAAEFRLKKVGFIFQDRNLINTLTVLENTEYVALLQRISEKRRKHEASGVLKDLGLEKVAHKKPAELSIGQQLRVALARAILVRPKLILADEPAANLDSKAGPELLDLMKHMGQNLGITFLLATHDKMIMEKARTLIMFRDGKITSQGPTEGLVREA